MLLTLAGLAIFAPSVTTSDQHSAASIGIYQADGCSDGGCDDQDDNGSDGAGANTKDKCAWYKPVCAYPTNKSDGKPVKNDK